MISVTLTLPWIILIALAVILGVWILTSSSASGYLGSDRDFAIVVSVVIMIVAVLIVGGFFWW